MFKYKKFERKLKIYQNEIKKVMFKNILSKCNEMSKKVSKVGTVEISKIFENLKNTAWKIKK